MTRAFVTFRSRVILLAAPLALASLCFTGRAWSDGQTGFNNNAICIAGGTNTCAWGDGTSCPLPPSDHDHYCNSNKMNPRVCDQGHMDHTCYWHTDDTCGDEHYCLSRLVLKDAMGHNITCDGLQDWCTNT
jgi:hypothetical protein